MMFLKLYSEHDYFKALDDLNDSILDIQLTHSSIDLEFFGLVDLEKTRHSVEKALRTCRTANIPIKGNFKHIFLSNGTDTISMWRLSDLAFKMVILYADPISPSIAEAHIEFARSRK